MHLNFDEKIDSVPDEVINDFKEEKFDECLNACETILSENPTNKIALIYSGIIHQNKGSHESALRYFDTVTEMMPNFRYVWHYKGLSLLAIKEYDQAKEAFMESINLWTNDAASWSYLALSVYLKGSKDAAYYVLDRAHEMVDQKDTLALAKGILEEYDGKTEDALISYMQSQILAPGEEKKVAAERIFNLLN